MTMELAFNIVLTIASAALGLLVKRLFGEQDAMKKRFEDAEKNNRDKIEHVLVTYQPRTEAQMYQQQIMTAIAEVKNKITRLDDKIERKTSK